MNRRALYLLIFCGISNSILACSCKWFDSEESKQNLYDKSDYVIKGHLLKNVLPDFSSRNKRYLGTDILLKVDSIYKGNFPADTIFIMQERGNCVMHFIDNNEYWVFGDIVNKIELYNDSLGLSEGYDSQTKTFQLFDNQPVLELYKSLQTKYLTLQTNQCTTFQLENRMMIDFVRRKKRKKD